MKKKPTLCKNLKKLSTLWILDAIHLKADTMPITKFEQDESNTLNLNTKHEKKLYIQEQNNNDILKTQT